MLTPGFRIRNDTQWPLVISLEQIGPLYYGLVQPGKMFVRDTGAVWFTVKARISPDNKLDISTWDAVWPVASLVGGVLLGALTGGASAFASVGASIGASALTAGGAVSLGAVVVEGAVLGAGAGGAATTVAKKLLADVFEGSSSLSSVGEYAGPPWPFRETMKVQTITGGPVASTDSEGRLHIDKGPALSLNGRRY